MSGPILQFESSGTANGSTTVLTFEQVSYQGDTLLVGLFCRNSSGTIPIVNSFGDNADPPNSYSILVDWQSITIGTVTYFLRVYTASVQANPDTGNLIITVTTSINQQRLTLEAVELTGLLDSPFDISVPGSSLTATEVSLTGNIAQPYEQVISYVFPTGPLTPQGSWILQSPTAMAANESCLSLYNPPPGANNFQIATETTPGWVAILVAVQAVPPPPPAPPFTSKAQPVGIYEAIPFYNGGNTAPPHTPLDSHAGWITDTISGVLIRINWQDLQPNDPLDFDFSYLDSAVALCEYYGKSFGLTLPAGTNSPSWIYSLGAEAFAITGQGNMPAPWDLIFQRYYGAALQAVGNRYDQNFYLAYVTTCGCGYPAQPTFCQSMADNQAMQIDAINRGFPPDNFGAAIWEDAYAKVFQLYRKAFIKTPVIGLNGPIVYPRQAGPWQQVFVTLIGIGPLWWLGLKDNGLSPTYGVSSWMANQIMHMSPFAPVGFQFLHAAKTMASNLGLPSAWVACQESLQIGCDLGGKWIEIYPGDVLLGDLTPYVDQLKANAAPPPPPRTGPFRSYLDHYPPPTFEPPPTFPSTRSFVSHFAPPVPTPGVSQSDSYTDHYSPPIAPS